MEFSNTKAGKMPLPGLVAHGDWSAAPQKRWLARAGREAGGRYYAHAPEKAGPVGTLLPRLAAMAADNEPVLLGVDFPIGLPARYAERAGINDFLAVLPNLGRGKWSEFYQVAESPAEISLRRPFYPMRPGNTRQRHLVQGLGVDSIEDLRRRCDRAGPGRRAAAPLFWTLGGQQVGKAAIAGWQEMLGPALRTQAVEVALWPFAGRLDDLYEPGRVIIAETYPAECYLHLGISFSARRPGQRSGKRVQADRRANGPLLLGWAAAAGIELSPTLRAAIEDGFGATPDGEDRFDAVVGLFGMLNVLLGYRPSGEPDDDQIRRIEGWILGQL